MKKMTILILSLFTLSLGVNAQLRVLSNGHVQVGDWNDTSSILFQSSRDTTNTVSILGKQSGNLSGGSISFGARQDVVISESTFKNNPLITGGNTCGTLQLVGKGGINFTSSNGLVFQYDTSMYNSGRDESTPFFIFTVPVQSSKYYTSSDARLKKNIESLENMGILLDRLTPVSYNLELPTHNENSIASKASSLTEEPRSFGFIAQEVREIFPELIHEDADGFLSVDYNGFIPLLVDAYKDLKAQVAEQQETIANLTFGAKKTKGTAGIESLYGDDNVVLMQNRPNPFKATTEIKCHLPQEVSEAFICIYDLNGRQQMRLDLRERGDVVVTVSGSPLQPGMYIYSIIADGREADSKRMILTE